MMLITFCSDDTWNQTPADRPEWLQRFKKDAGLVTDLPLPKEGSSFSLSPAFDAASKQTQSLDQMQFGEALSHTSTPGSGMGASIQPTGASSTSTDLLSMPLDMDMDFTDTLFNDIVGDMEFDFGDIGDI